MNPFKNSIFGILISAVVIFVFSSAGVASEVNKITKEELIKIMEQDTIRILDVRQERDWSLSDFKIKGAERRAPQDFETWANTYPKDKTLVLYCA